MSCSALKTTTTDTPMSVAMAVQRLAWPRMLSTTKTALTPSEAVMFWRMICMVRCEGAISHYRNHSEVSRQVEQHDFGRLIRQDSEDGFFTHGRTVTRCQ